MREVVLDTETTGLNPEGGDRIVEIGCVEVERLMATGREYHVYINPDRQIPPASTAVHGVTDEFVADKPRFAAIANELLAFIGPSRLVMHNAPFDLGFLNRELALAGRQPIAVEQTFDTLQLARTRFNASVSLDSLCRRYGIDLSERTIHGALKDAQLLARVYLELMGGREPGLELVVTYAERRRPPVTDRVVRLVHPTAEESAAHAALVVDLPNSIWARLRAEASPAADDPPPPSGAAER